jgi:hypothetical protein
VVTFGIVQWTSSQLATDVASWLFFPGNNFGWVLIGNEATIQTARRLSSREGTNAPVLTIFFTSPPGAGAVPNGASVPGTPLSVGKSGPPTNPSVDLSWERSCRSDPDYSVYSGLIGSLSTYGHDFLLCSTAGASNATFPPSIDDEYYLVVPVSYDDEEGSYGTDGGMTERPTGNTTCPRPRVLGAPVCP